MQVWNSQNKQKIGLGRFLLETANWVKNFKEQIFLNHKHTSIILKWWKKSLSGVDRVEQTHGQEVSTQGGGEGNGQKGKD